MNDGRTALVTGANRGIGRETCRQLAAHGLAVILTSRDAAAGREAAEGLKAAGLSVEPRQLDVTSETGIAGLADALQAERRKIDVLVNNAGIALDDFNAEVARRTIAANLLGPMRVTEAFLDMIPDGGTIVMVSSGAGELTGFSRSLRARFLDDGLTREALVALVESFVAEVAAGRHDRAGWPSSAYKVSKAALNALTRILARDLAARRIRVNSVCPGWVRTRMGGRAAPRSLERGAASVVWAALLDDDTTGGFFRDGRPVAW